MLHGHCLTRRTSTGPPPINRNSPGPPPPRPGCVVQVPHDKDYVAVAAEVAVDLHANKGPGDILVFLAGQAEVEKAVALINKHVCFSAETSVQA